MFFSWVAAHFRGNDAIWAASASRPFFSRATQSASLYISINTRLLWRADGKKQRNHRLPEWGHCNALGAGVKRYRETCFVKLFSFCSTQQYLCCVEGLVKLMICLSKERGRYVMKKITMLFSGSVVSWWVFKIHNMCETIYYFFCYSELFGEHALMQIRVFVLL